MKCVVLTLLEGKKVNLKIVEKEDLPLLQGWFNSLEFSSRYNALDPQESKVKIEKRYDNLTSDDKWFLIMRKNGEKVGFIGTHLYGGMLEIGYALDASERRHGYCTEAVQIMVDYLFLSKDIVRIQAATHVENKASQRVLEKAGFQKEATIRKGLYASGNWVDIHVYGILREEWKEPRILTKIH
jgi:ribosomal-protein-alanine N-acetyltransferase